MSQSTTPWKIAIIKSHFNHPITDKLLEGALVRCNQLGLEASSQAVFTVSGAVEIPLIAKKLAASKSFDAIITLGAVIRGETTHYDYVCQQVSDGVARVMYDFEIPVVFGVLTTENAAQAFDRVGGRHGHKGKESVDTAIDMLSTLNRLNQFI